MDKPSGLSVEFVAAQMVMIEATLNATKKEMLEINEFTRRQTQMIDLALAVMIAIAEDNEAPANIRRRITFTLQQIRGIGLPL